MSKVYLENFANDVQRYKRDIAAGLPSPQEYIPIIRCAIERYMMADVNSIDAVYIKVVYTSNISYCGSKYALGHILHSAGERTYFRVQYPDVDVYFREYQDYGVDNFFTLLVVDAICLEYGLICRISVEIIKNLDSDADFWVCDYPYLCEL